MTKTEIRQIVKRWSSVMGRKVSRSEALKLENRPSLRYDHWYR
jgi:hypothetical protein